MLEPSETHASEAGRGPAGPVPRPARRRRAWYQHRWLAVLAVAAVAAAVVALPLLRLRSNGQVAEAQALYEKGRYDQAEESLSALLRADRGNVAALRLMARVQAASGETTNALAAYAEAVRRGPRHAETLAEYAALERLTGDAGSAAGHYTAAAKADPRKAAYKDDLARTLMQLGRPAEAAAAWAGIARDTKLSTEARRDARVAEAQAWLAAGDSKKAKDALEDALRLVPKDKQAVTLLRTIKP